ncbi:sulfite exporter TauE/SafE family protein [Teredinibacter sp. KSP-S5-2]|uniref:sulfite exporter TauE/SafE family protein n=1 Tax=Teredinibacter sp. KSP-S5-2 TaxID=3034506 RepID=UPI002934986D|nr:sulfite exporter TauE/SafE family protein [Teredinibacter sp. KSP-S5-2]WNO10792.1 sulfite exporter TauE/SafE family protein [Teredinibacter sp. KSP-S5-2]
MKSSNTHSWYRTAIYWCPLFLFWLLWAWLFMHKDAGLLFSQYWQSSVTMVAGSFVAGATPLGGGAVAFPVFTKVLHVSSVDASAFSFMIQSVGMTFATLFFVSRSIKIYWNVILYAGLGSLLALPIGLFVFSVDNITARYIFSQFIVFCAFITLNTASSYEQEKKVRLFGAMVFGFLGGLLSSKIGSGCDALLFFYLVYVCRFCAKDSIPTTVGFMALNSIYASLWLLWFEPPNEFVANSWLVSAPVVSLGAPLGGYVLSKLKIFHTKMLIIFVIAIEVITTLLLVPFSLFSKLSILLTIAMVMLLLIYNHRRVSNLQQVE